MVEYICNNITNDIKIYFYKWVNIFDETCKKKGINLFIYGVYNIKNEEDYMKKEFDHEISKKNNGSNGSIYEKLCLGIRFIELIILKNKNDSDYKIDINEQKKEIKCLFEGKYIFNIYNVLEEISVFINNKKEKIILSFLQNNGDDEKETTENENITNFNVQLIDTYVYLYLRKYLNYPNNEENYKIIYFYNSTERIIDLSKYDFNIDNFEIRNWIFNNISFLLPSKEIQENEEKKKNRRNFLSIYDKSSNLKLSQPHHLSLFRLNSIKEDEKSNLSSKIVNIKLPNILIYDKKFSNFNTKSDNYTLNNTEKNNSIVYYLKCCNNKYIDATFHKISVYDNNLSINKKFIGYNKFPITEYIIDVPLELKLINSPFVFTNKRLKYLNEQSCKNNFLDKVEDNYYYVLKIEKENIENVLLHFYNSINIKNNNNFVSILTKNFKVDNVFTIIKFNLKFIMKT